MSPTIEDVGGLLRAADNILVIGHVDPDGDAVGSVLALTSGLRQLGKQCLPACADPVPEDFGFLPGACEIAARGPRGDETLIVMLDSSDLQRVGGLVDEHWFARITTVNVDHHVTNTRYADWNLVKDTAATAEIVYDLLRWLGVEIDSGIATCLLAGLVTDTRSFQTSSTSAGTLRIATDLVDRGAPLAEVTSRLFTRKRLASIILWAKALERAQVRGRIMWTEITRDMLEAAGPADHGAGELSSFLASADEVDVAVVFRETSDSQIDCAFRSSPDADVAEIAVSLGGGGHPRAAGCLVIGSLASVKEKVLAAVELNLVGGQRNPVAVHHSP